MNNPYMLLPGESEYASFAGLNFIRNYLEKKQVRENVTWFELEDMLCDIWIEAWISAKVDSGLVHIS